MKLIIIIGIAILLCTALYVALKHHKTVEKMENAKGNAEEPVARFFSMEGCPHCVSFDAEWKKFSGMSNVQAEKHVYYRREASDKKNDEHIKQYVMSDTSVVSSFPTVLFIDGKGNYVKYEGDRNASGLKKKWDQWVESLN